MLHKSKDVNDDQVCSHGVDPALFALWDCLKDLEIEGLEVKVDARILKVRIIFLQMYGDNLALNVALGFSRGFNGHFSCRICTIKKNDLRACVYVRNDLLRNEDNYKECLRATTKDERKGVKYDCILNLFQHY